ncbi:unnamed protein product [Polarella glacialis]|uniref:Uncharacterized protein n=1 Tax=Polarella glacialis TaxID=89957 RepID=A0A813GVA2_POLGL|nr:unnamed protein product [Polarella glacialis]
MATALHLAGAELRERASSQHQVEDLARSLLRRADRNATTFTVLSVELVLRRSFSAWVSSVYRISRSSSAARCASQHLQLQQEIKPPGSHVGRLLISPADQFAAAKRAAGRFAGAANATVASSMAWVAFAAWQRRAAERHSWRRHQASQRGARKLFATVSQLLKQRVLLLAGVAWRDWVVAARLRRQLKRLEGLQVSSCIRGCHGCHGSASYSATPACRVAKVTSKQKQTVV